MSRLHGERHTNRQQRIAVLMVGTALVRVFLWSALCVLYFAGAGFVVSLFGSVKFVAILSVVALLLTDWGQMAASLAQLSASHAHEDAEAARRGRTEQ